MTLTRKVPTYDNICLGCFSFYDSHKLSAWSWPTVFSILCTMLETFCLRDMQRRLMNVKMITQQMHVTEEM